MANYSLIINSKFQPFSYADLIAPVKESTEAHQKVESAYSDLMTQADLVGGKANEQTDPKAYAQYKAYENDLRNKADRLAKHGLTIEDRQDMMNLKARYAKDIIPIQEAIATRKKQAEAQQAALLQNPTLLLSRKASKTSLDEYLANPELDYQSYSGALLTQQVTQQASHIANALRNYGKGVPIDAYTNTFLKQYGISPDEAAAAIVNPRDPNSSPTLHAIMNNVIKSSGIENWGDTDTINKSWGYAAQGVTAAIGKSDVAPIENFGARKALELANTLKAQRTAAARGGSGSDGGIIRGAQGTLNPHPIRGGINLSKDRQAINKYIKLGYLKRYANGRLTLTKKGVAELYRIEPKYLYTATGPVEIGTENSTFNKWLKPHILKNKNKNRWNKWEINSTLTTLDKNEGNGDLYHQTEYQRTIGSKDQQEGYADAVKSLVGNEGKKIDIVQYDASKKAYVGTGTIDYDDKKLKGARITDIWHFKQNGRSYTMGTLIDAEGKSYRIHIPRGLNVTAENNLDKTLGTLSDYTEIKQTGYKPKYNSDGSIARDRKGNIIYTNTKLTANDMGNINYNLDKFGRETMDWSSQLYMPTGTSTYNYNIFQ